jgi:hypothetical protein
MGTALAARLIQIFSMNQYTCWAITVVENAVPLHVDIPRIGRRGSDLPFQAVLQEYLLFPFEYFLLVFLFWGYCYKL